jgi:allophanate hydrolase
MPIAEASLLTVTDWRAAACASGAAGIAELLRARRRRLAESATPHAWIAFVDEGKLEQRLATLTSLASSRDGAALLRMFPLFGVPFAVKDNIDAAGFATTAACPAWARQPERDATVVRKLLDAGAVLFGKTNLDQFATGLVGTRSPYGAPASTLAPARVSGGSSSGSAVVVAAGEVPFALGTDTAGSGRVPAGFNNIVGLKPTPGRVSTTGVLPACRSLDCVSIFALTSDDAAAVLSLIEGADEEDEYSAFAPGAAALPATPRIGVPRAAQVDAALGYDRAWATAVARARDAGAQIVEIDFEPLFAVARLLYDGPWVAERYVAVQSLMERDPSALDPTVAGILGGAARWNAAQTFAGLYTLQRGRRDVARLWRDVDVLMVPTAPRHPSFDEVHADPVGANAVLGTYTNFVNFLGWSALALPAGFTNGGLPFGITVIGPARADAALAAFGRHWQQASDSASSPLGATERRISLPAAVAAPSAAAASTTDSATVESNSAALPWPAVEKTMSIAVVGAHLSGLPLNGQLLERGATLAERTKTAASYRLYELPNTQPPKPGLLRVAAGGAAIDVEVWNMPQLAVGSFLALIPSPLGLGSLELAGGRFVHGFICEAAALAEARDITSFGGWRAWLQQRSNEETLRS